MIFTETKIKGAFIIEPEYINDERGFFARAFCRDEFDEFGLETSIVQCNISWNKKKGTLRGMHYQTSPHEEAKIVLCIKGAVYDVILDLRKGSRTYRRWFATELCGDSCKMLYIPKGCAHGFQTLVDDTVLFYQMMEFYYPECARGIRWDDPAFNIQWSIDEKIISNKDLHYPDYMA